MTCTEIMAAFWEHASQFVIFGSLIFGSQALARRAQTRRSRSEAERLRTMLRLGLRGLRDLYGENLRLLANKEGPLLSGRNQIALVRIQFGRLVSLEDAAEIEAVLSASLAVEAAEAAMAVTGKSTGGVAFTLSSDGDAELVKQPLMNACAMLDAAGALLAPTRRSGNDATSSSEHGAASGVSRFLLGESPKLCGSIARVRPLAWITGRRESLPALGRAILR